MQPLKILIVKPSSLGDVVHSLPFLDALSRRFPDAKIDWVIARGLEDILEGHPMIHRLWVIDKDTWKSIRNARDTIREVTLLFRQLKSQAYDVVVDLQGLLRSGLITRATGSPVRIGFREAREGSTMFYTHRVAGGKAIHAVDRYLKIAEHLGCSLSDVCFPFPPIENASSRCLHRSSFTADDTFAVLVPGARWITKRWPPEKFARVASLLPIRTVVIGSRSDQKIADRIVSLSRGKATSFAGMTNLKELIGILKRARFVLSNDSGPMHIAAALGVPVVALFGPTDPQRTGPYGQGHVIVRAETSCAPCFRRTCADMACMGKIMPEDVLEIIAAKRLIP